MQFTRARSGLRATLAVAVTLVLAGSIALSGAAPASAASAVLCKGYTACENYGMSNHGYASTSGKSYWRMYGGHNCTNYAAYLMVKAGMANTRPWTTATGNAAGWGVGMKKKTNTTPGIGSIAWWTGGAGHVAYVEAVISPTVIIVSEDNWGGDFYWRIIDKASGGWPKGFIHLKDRKTSTVPALRAKPYATTVYTDASKSKLATTTVMNPGSTAWVETSYLNTGTATWTGLQLATQRPNDHDSALAENWITPNRAAVQQQASVMPGGVATFGFSIRIPAGLADGTPVTEQFAPVLPTTGERVTYGTSTLNLVADSRSLFTTQPQPKITGTTVEGNVLTAVAGSWRPSGKATLTYSWKRDGVAISGQTASTYTLGATDVGRAISVTVKASAPKFISATSSSVKTGKVASKYGNTLTIGQTLEGGDQLVSANGKYRLYQRVDGALIVQDRFTNQKLWSNKQTKRATESTLTSTGSFAALNDAGKATWRTPTSNKGAVKVQVTNAGKVQVVGAKSKVLWISK